MPVNVLYCEGNSQSIDIRVIRQLLPRDCTIRPLGGKTSSFMESVISDRAVNPNLAGLVDHDFDCRDFPRSSCPIPYLYQNVQIGWVWERKEIENYLIDPMIVRRALGRKAPPLDAYQAALTSAAQEIATYTAARTALSCFGFKNFWGEPVNDSHFPSTYRFPRKLGKETCRVKIGEIVREFKGDRIVTPENVLEKFEQLLPLFRLTGLRFENFLIFFAGKDLLCAMRNRLVEFGFDWERPIHEFLERVVKGIERTDNVWTWLPEWQALRELIINSKF